MHPGGSGRDVRLLGTVTVLGSGVVGEGAPRSRTLVALLALEPGRFADSSALVDGLWGDDLPAVPRDALAVVVRRVREWIGDDAVATEGGGYRLAVAPTDVDRSRFLDAAARALDDGGTLAAVDAALGEWAGAPFGGCAPSGRLADEHDALVARRLRLVERRAELLLAAGRYEEVVATILEVLDAHRGRESLTVLLMTALTRLGRRDEALAAFEATRRFVTEGFGLDPGPALQAAARRLRSGVVRPTRSPIVGRDALLADLEDLPGGVVVIEGEAGIGKSALVAELLRRAAERGVRTVAGTVDDHGAPLGGWREALAGLADRSDHPERLTSSGVRAVLAAAAPVVVALDDVHRVDSASAALLSGLAGPTGLGLPAGVTLVLAARRPDVDPHPVWDAALADLTDRHARHLTLGALEAGDVTALVRARLIRLDDDAAHRVTELLLARTDGHPLHLRTLLDALTDQPDEAACRAVAARVPDRLRPLLEHQVASLPTPTRAAVETLAVLAPIDRAGLDEVLADETADATDDDVLQPAIGAGLVVADGARIAFRHELAADAARDRLPAILAAQLHLARLDAIERAPDPFTTLRHTLGAGSLVSATRRATARWRAGRAAYGRRAIPEALALLDAAADDLPDEHRADLLVHRGLALDALRREDAGAVLDAGMDAALKDDAHALAVRAALGDEPLGTTVTGDASRLARLRRMVGVVLDDHDRFEVLVALVREEGAVHGALPDGLLTAAIEAGRGLPADPRTTARLRALDARSMADTPAPAQHRLAVASEAYALAGGLEDDSLRLDATEVTMSAALAASRPDLARERAGELRLLGERHHRPRSRWAADLVETALLLCAGELDAADARASAALADGTAHGLVDAPVAHGAHLLVRHLLQGRAGELLALARGAAATMHNTAAWTAATALALSQTGDLEAARRTLSDYRDRRAERPGLWFDRPGLALAAAAAFSCGDAATAHLVREALPADPDAVVLVGFGAAVVGPAMLWTGLAAWTLGDRDTAREHLAHVADRTGALGWTAWATAGTQLTTALDVPTAPLPLGLVRPPAA